MTIINRRRAYGALVALAAAGALSAAGAAQASAAPAEPCYQKFSVYNASNYVLEFRMQTFAGMETGSSGTYPVYESRTIDMWGHNVPNNSRVRVHLNAVWGSDTHSEWVLFCTNGQTATWDAKGSSFSPTLSRT